MGSLAQEGTGVVAPRRAIALEGRIELVARRNPGGPAFRIQDAAADRMAEIARGATVSLIRTDNGQTVASAVTNDQGQFVLDDLGTFAPTPEQPYLLEAVKGLKTSDAGEPNAVGAAAARLRTLIVWNGGWTSFRNRDPGPLTISIGTTGLALLVRASGLDLGQQRALVGSLGPGDAFSLPAGVPGRVAAEFDLVWGMVRDALGAGQDPVAGVALPSATDAGSGLGRTGPPLSISRADPSSLEPGSSITFYGHGFSKVANENVLWVRTFTVENDMAISAAAVAPDGTWARFDAPAGLPVPGPMSRYRIEIRHASGQGKIQYDVPRSVARPVPRAGNAVVVAGDASFGGAWREGTFDRARFWGPTDIKLDARGNLYVCEHWYGNRIRVLAAETGTFFGQTVQAGQVATVVGTGYGSDLPRASRYNGNGLPVLETNLSLPWSIFLDPQGNLLITDYDAGAYFRVAAAADGTYFGMAMQAGKVYNLEFPRGAWGARGLLTDPAGNLYYHDWGERKIRFVPRSSGTFWGRAMNANQSYDLVGEIGSAQNFLLDRDGNLLVSFGDRVQMLAPTAGTFYNVAVPAMTLTPISGTGSTTYNGDGLAGTASAQSALGMALDPAGNLYYADYLNHRIRVLARADGSIPIPVKGAGGATVAPGATRKGLLYTVVGTGTPGAGASGMASTAFPLNTPYNVEFDGRGFYVADFGNNRIVYVATQ